eukprot:TRINITY_DN6138_c0_g1_i1.p1 TRINITY_DN6138_c0_g1~~TRINITY_DN6138_c0_g1_i1.p1  ORF type:complete len:344 (+),score=66.55 TRINITY_DN6138_c0_g1_i1:134-1165(+)
MAAITLVTRLEGHADRVWDLAWQPAGDLLASCSGDQSIRIWTTVQGDWSCAKSLEGPQRGTIRSLNWSPNGEYLASASFDKTACIWEKTPSNFECFATLEGQNNEVKDVAFSPGGDYIATCSRDKSVWIWERYQDEEEYECAAILEEHKQDVKCVRWHPSREILASCSYDNTINLYREDPDAADWIKYATLTGHTSTVWQLDFDLSGDRLVSVSDDGTVRIWQCYEPGNDHGVVTPSSQDPIWKNVCTLSGYHPRTIYSVSICKRTGLIATGCGDNNIRIFQQVAGTSEHEPSFELVVTQQAHTQDINCVAFAPPSRTGDDGSVLLASCSDDETVALWNVELA